MARINARLDDSLARKLDEIRRHTGQTTTAVLVTAIEQYHERLAQAGASRAADLFEETGFVGCADGPRDLATAYKSYLDFSKGQVREAEPSYGSSDGRGPSEGPGESAPEPRLPAPRDPSPRPRRGRARTSR